ncbi:MAG: TlpA disulfide reductase family protein [Pseudomonadota bacterium]
MTFSVTYHWRCIRVLVIALMLTLNMHSAAAVDMPLVSVEGDKTNLNQYQGKWVVVNYWATWCVPCLEELPHLQAFHDDHADVDAIVIGINKEKIGAERLHEFLETYFISYPVFVSKPREKSSLGVVPGLPTSFLISPQGEMVKRRIGPVTREMLEGFIANQE